MEKRNIYFVQANNSLSDSLFLPYASGAIAAYAFSDDTVKKSCQPAGFVIRKESVNNVINRLVSPFIIGFSSYMWNIGYNLELAKHAKASFPSCVIVFGGPQIPDNTEYLEKYDFIDYLIHGEGEKAFLDIIKTELSGESAKQIPNISFRESGIAIHSAKNYTRDIVDFPSPYSSGIFDSIIKDPLYKNIQFDTIVETNRGCPYNCIYCTWVRENKQITKFSMDRVKSDLLWIAQNKISYCICADGNFGIFDRDEEIVDYLIALKEKYGFPKKFETTAAKNKDDTVFKINLKLERAGLNRGVSVAVQSMSPTVLKIVGRKNQSTEELSKQLKMYRNHGIMTYTDIILGLPGETFNSFKDGLFAVMEAGQHTSLNINKLELLPNTRLASPQIQERYAIKTVKSKLCQNHGSVTDDKSFYSHSEIVVSTASMSSDDWRKALKLSICVQATHYYGLLRFLAMYLRKTKGIPFETFYCSFFFFMENNSQFLAKVFSSVCKTIDLFVLGQSDLYFYDERLGNIYLSFEEGLFAEFAIEKDHFYSEVQRFMDVSFNMDKVLSELLEYQKRVVITPQDRGSDFTFHYDWRNYFEHFFDDDHPTPKSVQIRYHFGPCETKSLPEYTREYVWYGRRSNKFLYVPEIIN